MRSLLLTFLMLISASTALTAQFNGLPASVELYSLGDSTVQVIFPKGFETQAHRTASTILALRLNRIRSLREAPVKNISIILQPYTTVPNAYVRLAPMKSEFFLMPLQNNLALGPLNWPDLLAIHEYRHVQQFYNAKVGATKVFSVLSGEIGWAVTSFLGTPNWFWEGDAVVYETALTTGGRGRYPGFLKEYRAFTKEFVSVGYDQARLGSFINYSPGHYPLGYMMNTYVRNAKRQDIWNDVFRDATAWRTPVLNMSRSLKKRTGSNASDTYQKTLQYFSEWWRASEVRPYETNKPDQITRKSYENIVEYRFVHPQEDGSLIALKTDFEQTESVVRLRPDRSETILARPGISLNEWFSANKNWMAWTELRVDPRWTSVDYSVVMVQKTNIAFASFPFKQGTRWFSPTLHPDGTGRLAAAEIIPGEAPALILTDIERPGAEKRTALPEYEMISHLAWDADSVLAVVKNNQKNALFSFGPDGSKQNLSGWTDHPIANPSAADTMWVFTSTFGNTEDIFAIGRVTKKLFRLTWTGTGAAEARVNTTGDLYYSVFSSRGYEIQRLRAAQITPFPVTQKSLPELENPINEIAVFEGGNVLDSIPPKTFAVQPYDRERGFINLHSWTLSGGGPDYTGTLYFDNILATLSATYAATWNTNSDAQTNDFTFYYSRFYPVIRGQYSYTRFYSGSQLSSRDASIGVVLPLQHVRRNHTHGLYAIGSLHRVLFEPASGYSFSEKRLEDPFGYGELGLGYGGMRRTARRQPYGAPGFQGQVLWRRAFDPAIALQSLSGEGSLFLPGLKPTHNAVLSAGFWHEKQSNVLGLVNTFRLSRGYELVEADGFQRVSANYTFPISYFHRRFGAMVYANRLRGLLFYDFGTVDNAKTEIDPRWQEPRFMRSYGGELILDTWWFRLIPMEWIYRYGYRVDGSGLLKAEPFVMITVGVVF